MKRNSISTIKKEVKKSDMTANHTYAYQKICYQNPYFLDTAMEEEKEILRFSYQMPHMLPVSGLREESLSYRLAILLFVSELKEVWKEYRFSLHPDNLYYDVHGRVKIMERDVREKDYLYEEKEFLDAYKALVGFALQKKYNYVSYLEGGLSLLQRQENLKAVWEAETVEALAAYLEGYCHSEKEKIEKRKILVDRREHQLQKMYMILITVLFVVSALGAAYLLVSRLPEKEALLAASDAYIGSDHVMIMDSLQHMSVSVIPVHQKYILAIASVKSENLNAEQKANVLSTLHLNSDERILDYWIYLGRLDLKEAENLAMQCSDDELLLYAYLKEKFMLENDSILSGEEKIEQLSALTKKIEVLAKQYDEE